MYLRYFFSVLRHKKFILKHGLKVGGIPLWTLIIHDWSKFLPKEFFTGAKKFYGSVEDRKWIEARNTHYKLNPHHWQHWISNGIAKPIPEKYVREMVADWLAVSESYFTSLGTQEYIDKNYMRINLYPQTVEILKRVLNEQGLNWPQ